MKLSYKSDTLSTVVTETTATGSQIFNSLSSHLVSTLIQDHIYIQFSDLWMLNTTYPKHY